jgi:hypothetical protein
MVQATHSFVARGDFGNEEMSFNPFHGSGEMHRPSNFEKL